jgi:hypothetical protein
MDIRELKVGATVWLEDGSLVEVIAATTDGESVRVKYVEAMFDAALVGTEADCTDYEIISYANDSDHADSSTL